MKCEYREKELELVLACSMDAVLEQAMLSGVCIPDPEDIVRLSSSQFPSRGISLCMYVCMYQDIRLCKPMYVCTLV